MLSPKIISAVTNAEAKALATHGPHGVNVVPVSVVKVLAESITLYDFFMGKTIENILSDSRVSLSCWTGLAGVQIKAKASYTTAGNAFDEAVVEMQGQFPTRTLKGLLILVPTTIFDISADREKAGRLLNSR